MAETDQMELEFKDFEYKIERLQKVETELNTLGTPEWREAHRKEIAAIEAKLKNPKRVDEAEHELSDLKKKLKPVEPPVQLKPPAEPKPPAEYRPPPYFPAELLTIYSSAEPIAKGGFARIFRVRRKKDGVLVAAKVPIDMDPAVGKSFLKEIENWQKLEHDNITRLLDCNILPAVYLEIELCDQSLDELAKPLMVERAAYTILEITRGLRYAHSKGVIHRDLKPSNILLKDDIPKISDWGLSKLKSESRLSITASLSPMYAAPEQYSPRTFGKSDERTDIFQLGIIFYELATGELPFKGEDLTGISYAITNEDPGHPSEVNPEAIEIEPIILKCLQKKKEERYQSVAELQSDLASFLGIDFKKSLNLSRNRLEKLKLCSDLIEVYASQGNGQKCQLYLNNLQGYVSTPELREMVKEEIKALEFYAGKEVNIADRLPRLEALIHHARMGE
jgi:serine/threonine protein kinase